MLWIGHCVDGISRTTALKWDSHMKMGICHLFKADLFLARESKVCQCSGSSKRAAKVKISSILPM